MHSRLGAAGSIQQSSGHTSSHADQPSSLGCGLHGSWPPYTSGCLGGWVRSPFSYSRVFVHVHDTRISASLPFRLTSLPDQSGIGLIKNLWGTANKELQELGLVWRRTISKDQLYALGTFRQPLLPLVFNIYSFLIIFQLLFCWF